MSTDASGEFNCKVIWKGISISGSPATLTVLSISSPPVPTNVAYGADATFSCAASGDTNPNSITFHYKADTGRDIGKLM